MSRLLLLLFLSLALPVSAGQVEHVVVVSIDGLRPTYYLEPERHGLKIPNLRRLMAEGAYADGMQSVFPTLTYPAHTSLVTGVSPRQHGIFLNAAPDPEMQFGLRWYVHDVRAPTLYQAAEKQGLRTGLVFWPVTLGARADAVFPEFWRGDRDDHELLRAVSTPGLVAGVEQRFPEFHFDSPPRTRDEALTSVAVHLIHRLRPQLLLLHLFQVDHAQHEYGLSAAETRAAIETADGQIGRLVSALKEKGLWERTVLFVVSDHGFAPVHTVLRPAILLQEAGLLSLDDRGRLLDWKAAPICGGGTCEILLREPDNAVRQEKVLELFSSWAGRPDSGVVRVYSPEETARLSPDRGAFIVLEAAPGFYFSHSARGELREPSGAKGMHGYSPERSDQYASFLVVGAGIAHRRLTQVSILDVAPTIALLLGLELPDTEGRVLEELLQSTLEAAGNSPP